MMNLTEELIKDIVADACGSLIINYQNSQIMVDVLLPFGMKTMVIFAMFKIE